jgi:hypothetical protein
MSDSQLLTPHEAEAVVEDRIEAFGLGALPRVMGAGRAHRHTNDRGCVACLARREHGVARCRRPGNDGELRRVGGRCRVPRGGVDRGILYRRQTIRIPTPYTTAISSNSASTELRSRNADAMAASNIIASSGIRFRSKNCCSRGRMRRCTTSSAMINRGDS